jgi:hypothetical protein
MELSIPIIIKTLEAPLFYQERAGGEFFLEDSEASHFMHAHFLLLFT